MKHGPGVTSAVDIIAPKPAARPEPSAKAASRDEDRASFADALDAETSEPEAAATKETSKEPAAQETASRDEPATPDANAAAQPAQPQQQQPTPAVNSAEAILAGLTQAVPTDAPAAEAGAATPAIDAASAAAQGAKPAATPQPAAPQADTAQAAAGALAATGEAAKKPATPAQAAPAAPATEDAPLAATGAEQASATIEAANSSNNKTTATTASAAADPAASKAQGAQNKPAQAIAATAEIKPEIKTESPAPAASTTPLDGLAGRTGATDIARAAPAHTAMQNAPATTVQVYQRMVERFDGRSQRYEIRLDPAELGRVDVRIEVGADKKVHAVLAAHDSAALTDLMRGQRSLERALNDAGIDLADGGIKFELSGDQGRNANDFNGNDGNGRPSNVWRGFNTLDVAVDAQTAAAARPWRSSARLDVVA